MKLDTQIMSMRKGNFCGFSTNEWTGLVEQADPLIRAKAAEIALA
ncbi:hypothetical protein ACUOFC_36445, partial [Escherichia sp. TWPC-MK]